MVRITRIDPEVSREVLDYLQVTCLPNDVPDAYKLRDLWFVAMDGDIPVGFAGIRPTTLDPTTWYLCRAGVLRSAQGKGLQKRLIRARLAGAKRAGALLAITDTTNVNAASANSLISCGFRVYHPENAWALPHSVYWRKDLCPSSASPAT